MACCADLRMFRVAYNVLLTTDAAIWVQILEKGLPFLILLGFETTRARAASPAALLKRTKPRPRRPSIGCAGTHASDLRKPDMPLVRPLDVIDQQRDKNALPYSVVTEKSWVLEGARRLGHAAARSIQFTKNRCTARDCSDPTLLVRQYVACRNCEPDLVAELLAFERQYRRHRRQRAQP